MKTQLTLFFTLFLFFLLAGQQTTIYVNKAATGNNDGSSWENAYTELYAALASSPTGEEFMVAEGVYTPDTANGSPTASFIINSDIELLGGYSATGEYNPTQYVTILSGDLNGDDLSNDFDNFKSDNVRRVVMVTENVADLVVIDGFTIQGGYANENNTEDGRGGGMRLDGPTQVSNCILRENFAFREGGAVGCFGPTTGTVTFQSCKFINNLSNMGGAVEIRFREAHFEDCTFLGNKTENSGITLEENGGAVFLQNSDCSFRRCSFTANETEGASALFFWVSSVGEGYTIEVDSCNFTENVSTYGGAFFSQTFGENSTTQITNSTFLNNQSIGSFSFGTVAIYHQQDGAYGNALVENCHFESNRSNFSSGAIDIGSGPGAAPSTYTIRDCTFKNNRAETQFGGLGLWAEENTVADFQIDRCTFEGNKSDEKGGGLGIAVGSNDFSATINHCNFINNKSGSGGAIYSYPYLVNPATPSSAQMQLNNSLIVSNTSEGGAITISDLLNLDLLNCTIADNNSGGIQLQSEGSLHLQNTILHNSEGLDFQTRTNFATIISNGRNIIGDNSFADFAQLTDQLETDPLFFSDGDICDHYNLIAASPAVGGGMPNVNESSHDMCSNDRVHGEQIDIGALESAFIASTSVEAINLHALDIYPNPVSTLMQIDFPQESAENFKMIIEDINGKIIRNQFLQPGQTIDVKEFIPGLYFLRVELEEIIYHAKFIKI